MEKFKLQNDGLYLMESENPQKIAGYLRVEGFCRNETGSDWGVLITLTDLDGKEKSVSIPKREFTSPKDVLGRLLAEGLWLNARSDRNLIEYLNPPTAARRILLVKNSGWHGSRYLLFNEVFARADEGETLRLESIIDDRPTKTGTLEEWQRELATLCARNPLLIFVVSAALTPPLLKLTNEESFIVHLRGPSSIGKTIALRLAASVWGYPIKSWRTTDNALEGTLATRNDCLACLDELQQCDPSALSRITYMVTSGGKTRADRKGDPRKAKAWSTIVISSGEISLEAMLHIEKQRVKAGQEVRFLDLEADQEDGMGIFNDIHGRSDSSVFANELKNACERHVGTLAPAFLQVLVNDQARSASFIKKLTDEISTGIGNLTGEQRRVGRKFALIGAVGEFAIRENLLPWQKGACAEAVVHFFKNWLSRKADPSSTEIRSVVLQFQDQLYRNRARFLDNGEQNTQIRTSDLWGFISNHDGKQRWCLTPNAFKTLCGTTDARWVSKEFIARGFMLPDRQGKSSQSLDDPVTDTKKRFYVILPSLFRDTLDEGVQSVPATNEEPSGLSQAPEKFEDFSEVRIASPLRTPEHLIDVNQVHRIK